MDRREFIVNAFASIAFYSANKFNIGTRKNNNSRQKNSDSRITTAVIIKDRYLFYHPEKTDWLLEVHFDCYIYDGCEGYLNGELYFWNNKKKEKKDWCSKPLLDLQPKSLWMVEGDYWFCSDLGSYSMLIYCPEYWKLKAEDEKIYRALIGIGNY